MTRRISSLRDRSSTCRAESSLAPRELANGVFEVGFGEVGPQRIDEDELRIGRLPEQEVANPLLTACSDQKIRIGNSSGRKSIVQCVLVDGVGLDTSVERLAHQPARGSGDLLAAAVADRHHQVEASIVLCPVFRHFDQRDDVVGQAAAVADKSNAHAFLVQLGDFLTQIQPEQSHQIGNLARRPFPILVGESVERKIRYAEVDRSLDGPSNRLGAALMARRSRQIARLGPSSVAVHDDGHMLGWRR